MSAARPIFLFGLGVQKAGTSWLHDYLSGHPEANFGPLKEYHVFDTLYLKDAAHFLKARDPGLLHRPGALVRVLLKQRRWPNDAALRRRLCHSPKAYGEFFANLVRAPGLRLTGDLTPSYGALSALILNDVRAALDEAGFDVRAVVLLRDPVERCLSASRMYQNRANRAANADSYTERALDITTAGHAFTEHAANRTRYDLILDRADTAFGPSALFVAFYEEFFSYEETGRLCDWLGVPVVEADFRKRVNRSNPTTDRGDTAIRASIANHYRDVYEYMFRRFGEERIRNLWPSAALLQ